MSGLELSLFKVPVEKSVVGVLKKNLRAHLLIASEPAKKQQDDQRAKTYGLVLPFVLDCAAFTVPLPTQPNSMFSIVTSK